MSRSTNYATLAAQCRPKSLDQNRRLRSHFLNFYLPFEKVLQSSTASHGRFLLCKPMVHRCAPVRATPAAPGPARGRGLVGQGGEGRGGRTRGGVGGRGAGSRSWGRGSARARSAEGPVLIPTPQ